MVFVKQKIFFETLNKNYGYDLTLIEEYLTKDNIEAAKGHEAVMVRANCDWLWAKFIKNERIWR